MEKILLLLTLMLVKPLMGMKMGCLVGITELLETLENTLNCTEQQQNDTLLSNMLFNISRSPTQNSLLYNLCEKITDVTPTEHQTTVSMHHEDSHVRPSSLEVWVYGNLCVLCISVCSLLGALLSPLQKTKMYNNVLTVLIGLAVGSLSGSSAFHLIPQAFGVVGSEHHTDYLNTALTIWLGIWGFFQIEVILKIIEKYKSVEPHTHGHVSERSAQEELTSFIRNTSDHMPPHAHLHTAATTNSLHPESTETQEALSRKNGHQPCLNVHPLEATKRKIAPVAYMVVFGDAIHNFIDGVSIGAAFTDNLWTGFSLSIAVFCEELPHELGDFAVLLSSGMSVKMAVCCNFISACTCFAGFAVGVLIGEIYASKYIFGFAAGMFLYISLVDMIPEMNHVATEAMNRGWKSGCCVLLQQNLGIGIGVITLYVLAQYQDHINVE